MKLTHKLLAVTLSVCISSAANAAFTIDLTGNNAYDGQNPLLIPFTDGANSATANLVPTGGAFNSNSGNFGIGDDQIDGTSEVITITFDKDIFFNFIDFGGVGAAISDAASLTVAGTNLDLYTGNPASPIFKGSTDVYTPTSAISVLAGQNIIITGSTATSSFDLERLNVTVVPEPGTFALLAGCCGMVFVMLKRRRA